MYTMDLTIVNASPADKGVYTCLVKDTLHRSENSLYVNVYSKNQYSETFSMYLSAFTQMKMNISSDFMRKIII